jgi:hypothetical protein
MAGSWRRLLGTAAAVELEAIQPEVPPEATTIVGISIYDMNELVLSHRRAEMVPIPPFIYFQF